MRFTFATIAFLAITSYSLAQDAPAATPLLSTVLAQNYEQTFAVLEADFPDDFKALTAAIKEIELKPVKDEIKQATAFKLLTDLRKKYRHRMPFAPQADQSKILLHLADFHDAVFKVEGPKVCGNFALNGAAALFETGSFTRYAEQLDTQSAAYFKAIVSAIESPDYHGPVTQNDWSAVLGAMVGGGAPESYLKVLADNKSDIPERCPALVAMFRTAALLKGPEGERARSDLAQNVTGY